MSFSPLPCKSSILEPLKASGASSFGIADACRVSDVAVDAYRRWIADECNGEMEYLARYDEVRTDPRLLLDGAQSIIVVAFNYFPEKTLPDDAPQIATYALGRDYHEVVRRRLESVAEYIRTAWGGQTRVCVDTAPLRERYWAAEAGVGFIGRNGLLIVPGVGSYVFIGTILTTVKFAPSAPCRDRCADCGACVNACPMGALRGDGSMDARRCLSYLTIEYRGELPDDLPLGQRVYGCDTCQSVCPHNRDVKPTDVAEFAASEQLLALRGDDIERMTQEDFSRIFSHSAVKRTKLAGLQRNYRRMQRGRND